MKSPRIVLGLLALSMMGMAEDVVSLQRSQPPRVAEIGQDTIVWERVSEGMNVQGERASVTNRWTELATGLTRYDGARQTWVPSVEAFEVTSTGEAVAVGGPHRLIVKPDIRTWGAIDLETADGTRFRSHLLGLAYTDPATGQSALIAEPKESVGVLDAGNRVVWQDALTDVRADVRLTYTRAGIEHDVVLLQAPPPPAAYGLPDNAMLEVWHEVVEAPELAVRMPATNGPVATVDLSAQSDQTIPLGAMTMGEGRAFSVPGEDGLPGLASLRGEGVQVRKSLEYVQGRRFLIEAVDYPTVQPELEKLPGAALPVEAEAVETGEPMAGLRGRVRPQREFPAGPARDGQAGAIQIARVTPPTRGFVLDYAVLNSTANVTLKGDTTYHVSGVANLTGVTTLEGAAIKFSRNTAVKIAGTLRCLTGPLQSGRVHILRRQHFWRSAAWQHGDSDGVLCRAGVVD